MRLLKQLKQEEDEEDEAELEELAARFLHRPREDAGEGGLQLSIRHHGGHDAEVFQCLFCFLCVHQVATPKH